ncbi:MAG TPA: hypothetical protein VH328_00225 [Burkholderiaceae bacterium]|nr:hypothetical protein [Burkholderiaceae bacterium]
MNRNLPTLTLVVLASCLTIIVPSQVIADSLDEPLEMDRGSNPDNQASVTYQAAIQAAERRLQQRLAQCEQMQVSDSAACRRTAQDLHDSDLDRASDVLHRPR